MLYIYERVDGRLSNDRDAYEQQTGIRGANISAFYGRSFWKSPDSINLRFHQHVDGKKELVGVI